MLVSAIMPTRGRRDLIQTALASFIAQDYGPRELVILDDDDDPSLDWGPLNGSVEVVESPDCWIRYFRMPRWPIGVKLEWLSGVSSGEVIVRFDSDDWSAAGRISSQVARLKETGKGLTGYHTLLFWDQVNRQGYRYQGAANYCCGTSFCYTREWWKSHKWPEYSIFAGGQKKETETDNVLVNQAIKDGTIDSVDGGQMCVARAHGRNSSAAARIATSGWPKVPESAFPAEFFEAIRMEKRAAA